MVSVAFGTPFFTGGTTTAEVPSRFDVALNGRPYMLDFREQGENMQRRSIQILRDQADTSDSPGEQSLNPEGLWRRSQESWERGAGQTYFDRRDSDPTRFRSSKGVDPFSTRWALGLLPDTASKRASANTNLLLQ